MNSRKKRLLIGGAAIVACGLGYLIYSFLTFEMFPRSVELVGTLELAGRPYHLEALYVGYGATTEDQIEIHKAYDDGLRQMVERFVVRSKPNRLEMRELSGQQLEVIAQYMVPGAADTLRLYIP